jgi:histidyl-tRNA synthetase
VSERISDQPVKGMRDFYPEEMRVRTWLFDAWRRVASSFGYEEYDSCVLESEELYIRKAGDEITGQLYNFEDKGGRRVSMRPEMTPSLARMLMAKGNSLKLPARWFSIPQCFRYEASQRGRKREHFQWNMDVIGLDSVAAEVELMSAQAAFLRAAGLRVDGERPEISFKVSNRQVLEHFLGSLGITGDDFAAACIAIDKRDKIGADATVALLGEKGVAPDAARRIVDLLEVRGLDALRDAVGEENPGYRSLVELMALATGSGIAQAIAIDLSVVRGLSYYTGTVWELFDTGGSVPRAIAGGGRYDRLMEALGGKPTPMVGFGFGDVVITLLLEERKLLPAPTALVDDVVFPMQRAGFPVANQIAAALRAAGRRVLVDYSERRFKHVVGTAEAAGARRMLILGESELQAGVVKLRSLGADRTETDQPIAELLSGGGAAGPSGAG